jgi:hypothetical protein
MKNRNIRSSTPHDVMLNKKEKKDTPHTYMSTSLNVVSIANVFWESFKRLAMRFLSLGIGTCSYHHGGYNCTKIIEIPLN